MKKIVFLPLIFAFVFILVKCEYHNVVSDEKQQITFIKTNPGGCNNQGEDAAKRFLDENDTLIFNEEKDTLNVFVGLNYICCAPFTTETRVSNDSIFISIIDTCAIDIQSCYCKCMCYYTWDFLFSVTGEKKFWFEIILKDPREDRPINLIEGWVDLDN
jgi:hypothetical protein